MSQGAPRWLTRDRPPPAELPAAVTVTLLALGLLGFLAPVAIAIRRRLAW